MTPNRDSLRSAQPCGCDDHAGRVCADHREEQLQRTIEDMQRTIADMSEMIRELTRYFRVPTA